MKVYLTNGTYFETPVEREPRGPRTADAVMGWVLDEATPAEIENLFGALGARFHEAHKQA